MESPCIFIGDAVTASGLRLAGVSIRVVPLDDGAAALQVNQAFQQALEGAALVLISDQAARHLPEAVLLGALRRAEPPLLVIPAIREGGSLPDLGDWLHHQLGLQA